jgi:hypothetical protein
MNLYQLHALARAKATHAFLSQNPLPQTLGALPSNVLQHAATLPDLIAAVESKNAEQVRGNWKERVSARKAAEKELRNKTLVPLRNVARVIVKRKTGASLSPDFADNVTVPRTGNVLELVSAARATVTKLAPYQSLFVARGISPDFLTQTSAQAAALETLAAEAQKAQSTQVAATNAIKTGLDEIRDLLACVGIAIWRACKNDGVRGESVYASWKYATRIKQSGRGSEQGGGQATEPTPVSETAVQTA